MKRRKGTGSTAVAGVLAIALCGVVASPTDAAKARRLYILITDSLGPDGAPVYAVRPHVLGSGGFGISESVTSPSGDVLDLSGSLQEPAEFDSLDDVGEYLFGEWVFSSTLEDEPAGAEQYRFSLAPVDLSTIEFVRPTFLQPADGAYVTSPFAVEWTPPDEGYSYGGSGVHLTVHQPEAGVLNVSFRDPLLPDDARIRFRASESVSLREIVSDVAPPSDSPRLDLSVSVSYSSVAEITVYPRAIPEPSSAALLALGSASLAAAVLRRRMGRSRRRNWRLRST